MKRVRIHHCLSVTWLMTNIVLPMLFLAVPLSRVSAADDLAERLERTQWQALRGEAIKVVATADDVIYALGTDARIYRWRSGRGWLLLPGEFTDVTIDIENKPWAIDRKGAVRRFNGLWWDEKGNVENARSVTASVSTTGVFILTQEGSVAFWQSDDDTWVETSFNPGPATVALVQDADANFWSLDANGTLSLASFSDKSWNSREVATDIKSMVANPQRGISVVTVKGQIAILDAAGREDRVELPYSVHALAFSGNQSPWITDTQGAIYISSSFMPAANDTDVASAPVQGGSNGESSDTDLNDERAAVSLSIARPINNELPDLRFVKVRDTFLESVEISRDGSVFGVTADQSLVRWRNRYKDFTRFPGDGVSLTTDVTGDLWLSNSFDNVFRLDDTRWQEINNISAEKVIATSFGEVYAISSAYAVYRFNTVSQRFERLPGITAKDIDTDPDGNVWVLTPGGLLNNCSQSPCEPLRSPRVDNFDIGPDGGFYIVSEDNNLYRRRSDELNNWEILRRKVSQVSVGPDNYPWVVDTNNTVHYSALFERNESNDTRFALSVTGDTSGQESGVSGITINRTMRFTQANAPQSLNSQSKLESTAVGDVFIAQYTPKSSGASVSTYVNTFCLNNPFDQNCGLPDICPNTQAAGCAPCNTLANQAQSNLCTAVTDTANAAPGDWINGYCLATPGDPGCSFPSQGTSADQVNCQSPMNQTHTVCVQYKNEISTTTGAEVLTELWRYDERLRRFSQVKKLPENTLAITEALEGELWAVNDQEVLFREVRNGVFNRVRDYLPGTGDSPVSLAGNDESVFILNSSQNLYELDDTGVVSRSNLSVVIRELAADSSARLWAIANGRLVTITGDNITVESVPLTLAPKALTVTITGDVYLILGDGIYRLNKATDRLEEVRGNYETPHSLAADSQGKLWVITTGGKLLRQI
jgi:hypothetical protein